MQERGTLRSFFAARTSCVRNGPGPADAGGAPASRASVEPLEGRTMMSAGPARDAGQDLLRAWAVSGSPQLTMKLASDATQRPRGATSVRGAYDMRLADMPNSDEWYGAMVNAGNYITSPYHLPRLPPNLNLVTDLSGTDDVTWSDAVTTLQATHPDTLVGTYHSSRDAQVAGSLKRYPRRAIPRDGLEDEQVLMIEPRTPEAVVVDYRQAAARQYLVDNVVQDVVLTGSKLAYLDNVSHDETGWPIDWATTMGVVGDMTTQLHAYGVRVIINAAWVPGVTSNTSVTQLIDSGVDGVSLEMGFLGSIRNSVTRINKAMAQYRRMLDAGMTVVFVALGSATGLPDTIENIEAEQRVQAAFGMMFRKPGDRLFTNEIFWRPVPEWGDWPSRFGAPLAAATVVRNAADEIIMSRAFANTTLTLNVTTKTVTYT
jgi:hypothetical protein